MLNLVTAQCAAENTKGRLSLKKDCANYENFCRALWDVFTPVPCVCFSPSDKGVLFLVSRFKVNSGSKGLSFKINKTLC